MMLFYALPFLPAHRVNRSNLGFPLLKSMFSKKATKIDEIFTVDLTLWSKRQIDGEDFNGNDLKRCWKKKSRFGTREILLFPPYQKMQLTS